MSIAATPIVMDHRVDLYIPSQCICTEPLPGHLRTRVMEEVKDSFDQWFGGHSEIPVKGEWRLPDGTFAKEEVVDIYAFCTAEALERHHEDVNQLAVDVANRLTQDRVLRAFDNLQVALWPNTLKAWTWLRRVKKTVEGERRSYYESGIEFTSLTPEQQAALAEAVVTLQAVQTGLEPEPA